MTAAKPGAARPPGGPPPARLIAQRLLLARQLAAVPRWVLLAAVTLLVALSLAPASLALLAGGLVGHLVQDGGSLARTGAALGFLIGVLLLSQAAEAAVEPLRFALVRSVDGAHRRAVEHYACSPAGIGHLEDPACQDDLLLTAGDPDNWTEGTTGPAAWAQLVLTSRLLGGVLTIAVVARDSVPAAACVLASMLVFRSMQRRGFLAMIRSWAEGMPHRRRATYWSGLLTGGRPAKEVRIFRFAGWLRQRYLTDSQAHIGPFRQAKMADLRRQWILAVIVLAALVASIYLLGELAIQGTIPLGRLSTDLMAVFLVLPMFSANETTLSIEAGIPRLLALRRLRDQASKPTFWSPPAGAAHGRPAVAPAGRGQDRRGRAAATGPSAAPPQPLLVRFEAVRFGYPNTGRTVLNGLDLQIRPGEVLGVAGLNGAGKSTLIKLLAALYEPDEGRITVGGKDLRQIAAAAWRKRLAVVFQDFVRYELSIRDNIALGSPRGVTDDDIHAAAAQAGITEMIEGLPRKWDTSLAPGDNGAVDLSGGQWQRIAMARALLAVRAGAWLVILDEPTAHLDARTESAVFSQLTQATRGASVVLISHRLSTIREAGRIAVIEEGRVAECGSHSDLMASDGTYARLFRLQAAQFAAGLQPVTGGVT